ncbi:MAG: hypothetical protein JW712_08930 [Dehalococcoidales bacterium]|nr:hypothetical protein [Dehalococcoidales bacterium]
MSLADLLNDGHLIVHHTGKHEISQLLAVYARDISDARVEGLSTERKFESAYNAGQIMARAALAAKGYRASGEGNHYWVIRSLEFTIGLDSETINRFDLFRRKRNMSNYERVGMVSDQETTEMITLAQELHSRVITWLHDNHPEYIGE